MGRKTSQSAGTGRGYNLQQRGEFAYFDCTGALVVKRPCRGYHLGRARQELSAPSPTQCAWLREPPRPQCTPACDMGGRRHGAFRIPARDAPEDGEFILSRGQHRRRIDAVLPPVLVLAPVSERPAPGSLRRMEHEYTLRAELDPGWAVRPLALAPHQGRPVLVLADPGGEPLDAPAGQADGGGALFARRSGLSSALGRLHAKGLIHKDIKPANVLVHPATGQAWLTGFGVASRLPRERQAPAPPELIAGTLAYMAPEQTGWMNRSIDARSDLYALGVVLYELLTGSLPFTASDPMAWVHAHIAGRPVPPAERRQGIPDVVSAIVMKLLAKTAEDRYQTAAAVERDLRRCLAHWEAEGRVDAFALAEGDTPDRLVIPEKLYGRAREIDTLLGAFERVVTSGTPELVLVSGYSGIGKSSVVNELHKVLVPPRGLFASGKFDQYKLDIPYTTLAQAFQSLVRYLLGKSDAELSGWRDALVEALGPNGPLMIDLVPELKLIIGDQPPVPELPPQDARGRFQVVLRRFIGVFARPDHPLALFIDDLQWLDAATLDLLEDLLTPPGVPHLMLIGAYRDNEVTAAHPLTRKLEAIRNAGATVQEIALAPLASEHVWQLVADALRCDRRAPPRSLSWCTGRRPAIRSSSCSFCRRSPRKDGSCSIMSTRNGPGISIASTRSGTGTTSSI